VTQIAHDAMLDVMNCAGVFWSGNIHTVLGTSFLYLQLSLGIFCDGVDSPALSDSSDSVVGH
jgi:hypothetical protein